jgi:hypothetical protein
MNFDFASVGIVLGALTCIVFIVAGIFYLLRKRSVERMMYDRWTPIDMTAFLHSAAADYQGGERTKRP